MKKICIFAAYLLSLFGSAELSAQSPGLIVRPAGGAGITKLNPDGNGFASATTVGFKLDDILESELAFKVVPPAIGEPTGDLATGPSGGFSDIVKKVDGSGFYLLKTSTDIFFRLRIGSIISGSKAYSVLIDTDGKIGRADPNYVGPSGNSPGNPGFEYEVVLETNFQVAVYSIDGTVTPGTPVVYPLSTNAQISMALSTDSNNPDYFYDWFVPLSAIGNPVAVRVAVTTVTSPSSALQGTRSDIYGIDDGAFSNTSTAWQTVIDAQPSISLSSFTGVAATCTSAPLITGSVAAGINVSVAGTWNRLDATKPATATISLFKNGVLAGITSVSSGSAWSVIVPTVSNGDVFYAQAQAVGESQCLQSNTVSATACLSAPAAPVLTCASLKGISGSMPSTASGNAVAVYLLPATTASPLSNKISTGVNTTYPTTTSFAFYTNGCSGGANNVATGTYMIITENGSCRSAPVFVCINSGSSGVPPVIASNSLSIAQPLYASHTSINGSGAVAGDILRLFINGKYQSSVTATASSFSFTGLTLATGDQLRIYSQSGSACITQSAAFTVSCSLEPPVIKVNSSANLIAGATSITGSSAIAGASVQVYKGISPGGVATGLPVTTGSSGAWSVTVPALISAESYYAMQTYNGCTSVASSSATVLTAAACPVITGTYSDASASVSGTMPAAFTGTVRLYQDGALIGSQAISAATTWTIPVASNTLYYGGTLHATAQSAGGTESSGCSTASVGCTSPLAPLVTPASSSIAPGQTVTYSITNPGTGLWYSLSDNSGLSYATSVLNNAVSPFNLTSTSFAASGTYLLKISADALTGCPAGSRSVTVNVNMVLPLVLLNFSGDYQDNRSVFNWSVAEAVNVSFFDLEQSTDGYAFQRTAQIPYRGNGIATTAFSYILNEKLTSTNYFRLRIVDTDGSYKYSRTISLTPHTTTLGTALVSPNPFTGSPYLSYTSDKSTRIQCVITNIVGGRMVSEDRQVNKGINQLSLLAFERLPAGFYLLSVTDKATGEKQTIKLQKEK
ncbi:T9SS type A sorting domain-containing protein [Terrimonas sp. NA20]|uniref:T9SS type A sorting domain-containing protein n=1 Tax=Terrimonas ginsenosidimutans TaxID=2908004 RepID=A0ABS9KKB6_9BACT|nr:T9SS type A sorting domain-containing protein [Terrimonas ginsenosidimutans]MCG2612759.1 T9SS type A sorting domain-containing protein [Terrimonas ginsenosidimutans]